MSRPVAFFDFDGTLTRGDSLLPFLRMLVGPGRFYKNLARLSPVFVAYALKILDNGLAKEIVLRNYLSGMRLDELNDAGQKFATEVLPKIECTTGMARLHWHQSQGHLCVLVSASLDVYLKPWAAQAGFDDYITSSLEVDAAGFVTGRLKNGNCFGDEKVRRIKFWLQDKGVSGEYAYGDSKGDLPMLHFARKGYLKRKNRFQKIMN